MKKIKLGYKPDIEFWNWLAGFWEGEGSLILTQDYKRKDGSIHRHPRLTIAQVNRKPLDYIIEKLQMGTLYFRKPRKKPIPFNEKGTWMWNLNAREDVIFVCESMLPYLRFREQQVIKMLEEIKISHYSAKWKLWTNDEIIMMKLYYDRLSRKELCDMFARKWSAILQKAKKLGLEGVWIRNV